jgi:hypothetical protein
MSVVERKKDPFERIAPEDNLLARMNLLGNA